MAMANDYLMQVYKSPTPFSQFGTFLKDYHSSRAPCSIIGGLTELYFMLTSSGQSCFLRFLTVMSPKMLLIKLCACTSPSQSVFRKPRLRYILGAEGAECWSLECGLHVGALGGEVCSHHQGRGARTGKEAIPKPLSLSILQLPSFCASHWRLNWKPASKWDWLMKYIGATFWGQVGRKMDWQWEWQMENK